MWALYWYVISFSSFQTSGTLVCEAGCILENLISFLDNHGYACFTFIPCFLVENTLDNCRVSLLSFFWIDMSYLFTYPYLYWHTNLESHSNFRTCYRRFFFTTQFMFAGFIDIFRIWFQNVLHAWISVCEAVSDFYWSFPGDGANQILIIMEKL